MFGFVWLVLNWKWELRLRNMSVINRRRQWQPTPVLLHGKSHGWRSLVGYTIHRLAKSWTRLSNFIFTFHFHALEKEMETHSSILAWRIPRTEEPGGLPSIGSHRVGHDWRDLAAAAETNDTPNLPEWGLPIPSKDCLWTKGWWTMVGRPQGVMQHTLR